MIIKDKKESVKKELKENQKKCIFFTNKFQKLHTLFTNNKQINKEDIKQVFIAINSKDLRSWLDDIGAYRFFKNKEFKLVYEYLFKKKDIELLQLVLSVCMEEFLLLQSTFQSCEFSNYYFEKFETLRVRKKTVTQPKKQNVAYIHLQSTLEKARKKHGLTKADAEILYYTYAYMRYSKSDMVRLNQCIIADKLGLSHKTVNQSMKKLQQLGFVRFESKQLSGRSNIYYATENGKEYFKDCFCANTYHRFKDTFKVKYKNRHDVDKYKESVMKKQKCNTIYNNKNLYINSYNISHKNMLKKDRKERSKVFIERWNDERERKNQENVKNFRLRLFTDEKILREIKEVTYLDDKTINFLAGKFERYYNARSHKLRFVRNITNLFISFAIETMRNDWIKPKDFYTQIVIIKHKRERRYITTRDNKLTS